MNEIIYGIHSIQSALKRSPERFQEVVILKERKDKRLLTLIRSIKLHHVKIHLASRQSLNKKSKGAPHQGIIAYIKPTKEYLEKDFFNNLIRINHPFLLILDGITDPHNLGACIRSADAAGVNAIIVPKNRSVRLNSTVKKVACGAAENVPVIRVTNLARTMCMLKKEDIWIIGTTRHVNNTLYQSRIKNRIALVMGSEDKGMRRLTREHCNELIRIPTVGKTPSLNVSTATGICLFEVVRHRLKYSI